MQSNSNSLKPRRYMYMFVVLALGSLFFVLLSFTLQSPSHPCLVLSLVFPLPMLVAVKDLTQVVCLFRPLLVYSVMCEICLVQYEYDFLFCFLYLVLKEGLSFLLFR